MQCDPKCSKYSPCISSCPLETCDNILQPKTGQMCAEDVCIEGCDVNKCQDGYVFSNNSLLECVPKKSCRPVCLVENGITYFENDKISSDRCHSCVCSKGKKLCAGVPCLPTNDVRF
jgi:von Willebrand factor